MIKLEGLVYGKKVKISIERAPHVCISIQERLDTIFDLTGRQGCPNDCPYIYPSRDPGTDLEILNTNICDVMCKEIEKG